MKKAPKALSHVYSLAVIAVGFGIFHFESLPLLGDFFKSLVGLNGNAFIDLTIQTAFMNNIFLFIAAVALSIPWLPKVKSFLLTKASGGMVIGMSQAVFNAVVLVISSIMLVGGTNNPFLYFRF